MFGAAQARQRAQIFSELTALVHAGVNIGPSLGTVAADLQPSPMKLALQRASVEVSNGQPLSTALRAYPRLFPSLAIAMIEVGERGGRLEEALRGVRDHYDRDLALRYLLIRELTYPIILFAAIIFIPMAGRFVLTLITAGLADAVRGLVISLVQYALILGIPATVATLVIRGMARSEQGRLRLHAMMLRIPIIGRALRKLAVARFCRALASLYSAGVMLGTSIRLAGEASANEAVRRDLTKNVTSIERGAPLSEALGSSKLLPPAVLQMLRTGETTGDIDAMAQHVAGYLELEAQTSIKQLTVSLMPIAVLIAGIIIGVMVISFYLGFYGI